jgi:hypothetical protein
VLSWPATGVRQKCRASRVSAGSGTVLVALVATRRKHASQRGADRAPLASLPGWLLLTARLSGHQIMINGHALCPLSPSWLRPCQPGAAVGMERPKRSQDERPGPSAIIDSARWQPSGAGRRGPPWSRNVTSCGTTAAPVPPDLFGQAGIEFSLEIAICPPEGAWVRLSSGRTSLPPARPGLKARRGGVDRVTCWAATRLSCRAARGASYFDLKK